MVLPKDRLENAAINFLRDYLKKENINQRELGKRLGWSDSYISEILNKGKGIGTKSITQIVEKLNVPYAIFDKYITETPVIAESPAIYGLNDDDIEIARIVHNLSAESKKIIREMIALMVKSDKIGKKKTG